jgi:outer membrane protein assembly factor BamB
MSFGQWPQWRGPNRDGGVAPTLRKVSWPEALSLLWDRDIGGGYAGPVSVGDSIWLHTRQGNKEVVSCLRLDTGDLLWSKNYDAPFQQDTVARFHGNGPYSTPSYADGRLFTFGVTSILSAWDAKSGNLLWRRESAKEFNPSYAFFGTAASPLVWSGLCFVHLGGHQNKPDNPGVGAIVALNVSDGREMWRWSEDAPAMGASPVVVDVGGHQLLVFKTRISIVGLDPATGKKLWQIPYKASQDNTIVTPLFVDGCLVTSDYDMGIAAWRIQPNGAEWTARELWRHREASLFLSSPVLAGGILVGFSHFQKGQLFGLDPSDGKVLWRGAPRSGEHASLISWGKQVLVFLEDGSLMVGDVFRDRFQPLRKYRLGSLGAWAHPALVENRILVKDGNRLAVYGLDER